MSLCSYFKNRFPGYTKYMLTLRNIVIRSRKQYPPKFYCLEAACHCNVLTFWGEWGSPKSDFKNNFLNIPKADS